MTPRVRVVVLNHNGGELTLECLRRLTRTDWPADALELVLVDNASTDQVVGTCRRELPSVRIVESPVNRGFAGGCNLALRNLAVVDHVSLVNSDVLVDPGWLAPLVEALDADPALGAASPKIVLAAPMTEIGIRVGRTRRPGRGDDRDLGIRVRGVRVDGVDQSRLARFPRGFWGPEPVDGDGVPAQWSSGDATLLVPAPRDAQHVELLLDAAVPTDADLVAGAHHARHRVTAEPAWCRVELRGVERFDVVNNAGSVLGADGYGADRGYLEPDRGQYDTEEDVFAWCGGAVLLRAGYLRDVGLFDERLFLYYEDLELSWRGRERGWRYRYVPSSVVRHVHTASTVQSSRLADHFNERNRLLVLTRHGDAGGIARALARYAVVTASYARRDIASPLLRGEPPRWEPVRRRVRALAGYARLAPAMLRDRAGT